MSAQTAATSQPMAQPRPATSASQQAAPPRPAPACCGYPFPRALDAEIADSDVHHVHYEDEHVMFLEVSNPPLLDVHVHGHPYISVFAHDSDIGARNPAAPAVPLGGRGPMDPASPYNNMGSGEGPPPRGTMWPTCTTAAPQAPHRPFNSNVNPNHFFRLEFLRVEGEEFQDHWREWYPWMAAPVTVAKGPARRPAGPGFSAQWPYPIAYDSILAAPNNYRLLFENEKVRLLEVTIRPGETTPMHGHPYPSVLTYNSISGKPADVTDIPLDPASPLNGQGGGHGAAPTVHNLKSPTCATMTAQAPHTIRNGGSVPIHYYRIEYKRIDGDLFASNWLKWYPWMRYMPYMR